MLETDTSIAVVSSTCLEVPPSGYGGLERIVYDLCVELAERSYDVTCIGPEGTEIEGVEVIETLPPDDSDDCFEREPEAYEIYADRLAEFDLVIDHSWQKHVYRRERDHPEEMADTTVLGVWHGMPSTHAAPVERPNYVSVSWAAAEACSRALGVEVRHVYNGIDLSEYPLEADTAEYAMTLNRITPEKGIEECVAVADHLGVETKIVGEDEFVGQPGYVADVIRRCGESRHAEYVGQVSHERKLELLQDARALLLLPQDPYREVFGLAAVEAMACGTPVLATDNCGLAEVVETVQGRGAYDDLDVLAADLERIMQGDDLFPGSEALRAGVEEHFSRATMTDVYLERAEEAMREGWG